MATPVPRPSAPAPSELLWGRCLSTTRAMAAWVCARTRPMCCSSQRSSPSMRHGWSVSCDSSSRWSAKHGRRASPRQRVRASQVTTRCWWRPPSQMTAAAPPLVRLGRNLRRGRVTRAPAPVSGGHCGRPSLDRRCPRCGVGAVCRRGVRVLRQVHCTSSHNPKAAAPFSTPSPKPMAAPVRATRTNPSATYKCCRLPRRWGS